MLKTIAITAAVALAPLTVTAEEAKPVYMVASVAVSDFDAYMGDYGATAIPLILEACGEILVGHRTWTFWKATTRATGPW